MNRTILIRVVRAQSPREQRIEVETCCQAEADAIVQALVFAAVTEENVIGLEAVKIVAAEVAK